MRPWLLVCAIVAFAHNAFALNQFRRPGADGPTGDYSENPVYEVGKDITFLWDTDFDQIDLVVWSDASYKLKKSLYKRLNNNLSSRAFTWKPSFDGFPAEAQSLGVFYLTFYQAGTVKQAAKSHYFNITQSAAAAAAAAASASAPVSNTSAASTTNSASPTPAVTSDTFSPTISDSSSNATATDAAAQQTGTSQGNGIGLSAGVVAGIAAGVALGTMLVVGAAGLMAWGRHRKKEAAEGGGHTPPGGAAVGDAAQGHYASSGYAPTGSHVNSVQYASPAHCDHHGEWKNHVPAIPVELDAERTPELGGGTEHTRETDGV